MDFRKTPICKRTRLQENLFLKKYCEEKKKARNGDCSDKKGKKRVKDVDVVIVDENVDDDQENHEDGEFDGGENLRNTENRGSRKGVKRARKGGEDDDYVKNSGKKIQKGMEMKKGKNVGLVAGCNSKQKRGFENEKKGGNCVVVGDDGDDVVFLGEQVVSNGDNSKVPSSLGSGLNSECVKVKNFEHVDADEVVSSSSRRDKDTGINDGVSRSGLLRTNSSDVTNDKRSPIVYVLSSEESSELSKSGESFSTGESSESEESESELPCQVDEPLRSQTKDDLSSSNRDNREEKEEENFGYSVIAEEKIRKDSVIFIDEDEEVVEEEEEEDCDDDDDNYGVDDDDDDDDDNDDDDDDDDDDYDDDDDSDSDYKYHRRVTKKRSVAGKIEKDPVNLEERREASTEVDTDSYCTGDGEDEGTNKNVKPRKGNHKQGLIIEDGLERKKTLGLDVLIDSNIKVKTDSKSIARRTRSHSKSRKKNPELGKYSRPLVIDTNSSDDKSESSADSEGPRNEHEDSDGICEMMVKKRKKRRRVSSKCNFQLHIPGDDCKSKSSPDSEDLVNKHEDRDGKCEKMVKELKKRRRVSSDSVDYVKILVDSMMGKEDLLKAQMAFFEVDTKQEALPLKFTFEDEKPASPEKSIWEKESDALFLEMGFALMADDEISSTDSSMETCSDGSQVVNDVVISSETESSPAMSCHSGEHDFILDETIGLKCRFCSFVQLEMKYIVPPFAKDPFKRWEKKYSGKSDSSFLDRFQFQDDSLKDHFCAAKAEGTVWDIIPQIKERMYPHQVEGFEFIWKNLAGGINIEDLKRPLVEEGQGCIISHAPGTGKTFLAITFLLSFMTLYPAFKPVIIAPCSMLLTWEEEFRKWNVNMPFHNLNNQVLSGNEHKTATSMLEQLGKVRRDRCYIRLLKLYSWTKDASVLGISYRLFENLAGEHGKKGERDQIRKILLEQPGVLVLDEGHTPRNGQSLIWKALSGVKTKRRILLSGTPFQNNFKELFNTVCLVNPKFSDHNPSEGSRDHGERSSKKTNIAKGKWDSLTNTISKNVDNGVDEVQDMATKKKRIDELRNMIAPFVHVYKGNILQDKLPGLRESVLILRPTDKQKDLLTLIKHKPENFPENFRKEHLVSLISLHPSLVANLEEFSLYGSDLKSLKSNPDAGVKTKLVMEIIRLSELLDEKVLVFSQYIEPLSFVKEQLMSNFGWCQGREVLYMDGSQHPKQRQLSISSLNDPNSEVRVLLASTRACCEGINLVGASRVIFLDVVWNHSPNSQAISRSYRLGQKKVVHVYHLIIAEEIKKFERQSEKLCLSELMFSSTDDDNTYQTIKIDPHADLEDKILEHMVQHKSLQNFLVEIHQRTKGSNLDLHGSHSPLQSTV